LVLPREKLTCWVLFRRTVDSALLLHCTRVQAGWIIARLVYVFPPGLGINNRRCLRIYLVRVSKYLIIFERRYQDRWLEVFRLRLLSLLYFLGGRPLFS
jgi:hypothetical protein